MKKLQPYYLMARKEGASAEESVLIDPLSLWTYFTNPIHWAPDLCLRNHDFTRYPNCTYITKRFTWHHPRRAIEATSCSQQCMVTTSDKHIMSTGCFHHRRADLQCDKQIRPSGNTTRNCWNSKNGKQESRFASGKESRFLISLGYPRKFRKREVFPQRFQNILRVNPALTTTN